MVKNKYVCDTCSTNTYDMEFISSTMFESYEHCPYSFYHEYIKKSIREEERQNKYSVTGNLLHDLFEKYSIVEPRIKDTTDILVEYSPLFDSLPIELFEDDNDRKRFKQIGQQTIINWVANEVNMKRPMVVEQQHFLKLHEDLPTIRVTMDRVNQFPDGLEVWDYKTGKVYSSEKLRHNMQLPIYTMACKRIYGELPQRVVLHFPQHDNTLRIFEKLTDDVYSCRVPRGGTYTFSLEETTSKMIQIYKQIKNGLFEMRPQYHFCKSFCAVSRAGLCSATNDQWRN